MIMATVATFYAIVGLTAMGSSTSFHHGNPRILAVSLDQRHHLGQSACVTFPGGSRITYRIEDLCPRCRTNQVDILVSDPKRALRLGKVSLTVSLGRCK